MNEIIVLKEGVHTVYQKDKLVAIIKRDDKSGHHLVYLATEATSSDIADLLNKTNERIISTPEEAIRP